MAAPQIILDLVQRFSDNLAAYKAGQYNETQVRHEFIDPFFEALGWDINNKQGFAEAYKDVIHEDTIKIGGFSKAPDYSFRIGGTRKFFVEAKKPSVHIKEDVQPAYQLRRYAWSAKLPISILTDFEEFAVYDSRKKPIINDKASTARIMYLTFKDYPEKWDEIARIFSREAILMGAFDRFVAANKGKGTEEVDNEFLKEIEGWREILARNLALRNQLAAREINYAVQKIIDRIIFLRICEDRGIEIYGQLQALQNGQNVYKRLVELFYKADDRYDSGIFHFQHEKGESEDPDLLTPKLAIDDQVLKDIFKSLYYPESPYEFSVLPADILGQVYEQFLGKVIRLTSENRIKIEEKPEVKKAGGVFYTPTYIVQYIVKATVGKLIEGKSPKQTEKIKILDPACGSGSFLIGAYQCLLDWHLRWYVANEPIKHTKGRNPVLYQGSMGDWRLTTNEKKRILLNNVYGVDIDAQAVEVTKLSLLLKVLEGESEQTITRQMKLFHERALPDLGNNIKCGNSLIGTDFYRGVKETPDDEDIRLKINTFNWHDEFPKVFEQDGFDAVIGNPPYVRQELLGDYKDYFSKHYQTYAGTADLYVYFFEQGHKLLKPGGLFGVICSNKFMRANYGKALRNYLSTKTVLNQIIDFGELPVFANAATFPAIFLTESRTPKKQKFVYAPVKRLDFESLEAEVRNIGKELNDKALCGENWTLASKQEISVFEKMKRCGVPLGEYVKGEIYRGVLTGLNKAFVIDEMTKIKLIDEDPKSEKLIKPFIIGDDIRRYHINLQKRYLLFVRRGTNIEEYPAILKHLYKFKEMLLPKPENWKGLDWNGRKSGAYQWFEIQDSIEYHREFEKGKIIYPVIAKEPRFAFDRTGGFSNDKSFFIPVEDFYLLGVLNSKLCWSFLKRLCSVLGDPDKKGRLELRSIHLKTFPVAKANNKQKKQLIELVKQIISLQAQILKQAMPEDKKQTKRQIIGVNKEIEALVYGIYGLNDEEIKMIDCVTYE